MGQITDELAEIYDELLECDSQIAYWTKRREELEDELREYDG